MLVLWHIKLGMMSGDIMWIFTCPEHLCQRPQGPRHPGTHRNPALVLDQFMDWVPKVRNFKWYGSRCIWVNYNISLTWIKAVWGWFPLLTMIPGFGRSEVVIIYPDGMDHDVWWHTNWIHHPIHIRIASKISGRSSHGYWWYSNHGRSRMYRISHKSGTYQNY